jgi:hypothetical protein
MLRRRSNATLVMVCLSASVWLCAAHAQAWSAGGHLGLNLDQGDIHVGFDLLFPVVQISPNVQLEVWPSAAHVFRHHAHDVELFGVDFPFAFNLGSEIVAPYVGPGLGLAVYDGVSLKFNVVGGLFFNPRGPVRPFGQVALRFVHGTFVDMLFGVLFEV